MQQLKMSNHTPESLTLSTETREVLEKAGSVRFASSIQDLEDLACGGRGNREWKVAYTLPDGRQEHDDMGLCHSALQEDDGKLRILDAERAWFVRVNHILGYGTDHDLERLTVAPPRSLLFLNIDAVVGSTALIWEHLQDEPGVACPNPRVILPREIVPGVTQEKVAIDIRSFGVRTPACTKERPTYGIFGLFHILPPALAWLWRLVAPRGHSNPSIVDEGAMSSEGVTVPRPFFQVDSQPEVGPEAYDAGARVLAEFFHEQIRKFLQMDLHPLGQRIIECCLAGGDVQDYEPFIATDHL